MEAEILLVYDDEAEAEAIFKAVSPDNVETPNGLVVETQKIERKVVTTIKYRGDNIATLLSTIDDLLKCVLTAEKTISAAKNI
ncbi:hypothetical protein KEJ34_05075 [Candidatus Bathyarchaeota archaeon]|nr:hypothetical protein [Candidatus Bathyarchaeota archaeon]